MGQVKSILFKLTRGHQPIVDWLALHVHVHLLGVCQPLIYVLFYFFISYLFLDACLDGATLFYTSVKENKNCSLLYKYIAHQIYGLPFSSPALVVDKESVFM